MFLMAKWRVAVLRGGPSEEYAVSLKTGKAVVRALEAGNYQPIDITLTPRGEWVSEGRVWEPARILETIDVVFNALHGTFGEDGQLQRMLDRYGVPYTGSRAYPAVIAMNKVLAKEYAVACGLQVAPHMRISPHSLPNLATVVARVHELLGEELVVKPVAGGSSLHTSITLRPHDTANALAALLKTGGDALVERRIRGKEVTAAVVERFRNEELYALPEVEIELSPDTFFDYRTKYERPAPPRCPGRFSYAEQQTIRTHAKRIHRALGLRQYSRSDFILAEDIPGVQKSGLYFLETNALPGLTESSLVPCALAAVGCEYPAFIDHVLTDTLSRRR